MVEQATFLPLKLEFENMVMSMLIINPEKLLLKLPKNHKMIWNPLNRHPEVREVVSEVRVHDLVLEQVRLVQEENHRGLVEPLVTDYYPSKFQGWLPENVFIEGTTSGEKLNEISPVKLMYNQLHFEFIFNLTAPDQILPEHMFST